MKLRALVVDDELLARQNLALMLHDVWGIEVVGLCGRADEVVETVYQSRPDLVFLDIQMPGENGIALVEKLKGLVRPTPAIIFVTAHEAFAVEAFGLRATDYLLKPFSQERLQQAVTHARLTLQALRQWQDPVAEDSQTLVIHDGGQVRILPVPSVWWIAAADHYLVVHGKQGNLVWRKSLSAFLEQPQSRQFLQIHRSTLVNRQHVVRLFKDSRGRPWLEATDKTVLKVSRRRYPMLVREFSPNP